MPALIDIRDATVYRGHTRVFHRLSLRIERECHTAILGPNGAGKSTLLKLLCREIYQVQDAGSSVSILGEETWNVWELRAHLGILSSDLQQGYIGNAVGMNVILSGLYSSIDVWDYQEFTKADRSRAENIMRRLGVHHLRTRCFAEMSTGEQRRFLLGRALINNPRTLVLDEPTSGLDLKACFQYLDLLRRLMRRGTSVVLVTHHIHEIPPEVTRVVLLKKGRVVADGKKEDVMTGETLSALFGTRIHLVRSNGYYQALPGRKQV
ncbi:ATP-binding cassette domain-containing protein [bacterium]|nr:ATP-binding cassette domain-containing protein [bacterium]